MNIKKILSVGLIPVFMLSVFAYSIPQVFADSVPFALSTTSVPAGSSLTGTISGLGLIPVYNSVGISINGGAQTGHIRG